MECMRSRRRAKKRRGEKKRQEKKEKTREEDSPSVQCPPIDVTTPSVHTGTSLVCDTNAQLACRARSTTEKMMEGRTTMLNAHRGCVRRVVDLPCCFYPLGCLPLLAARYLDLEPFHHGCQTVVSVVSMQQLGILQQASCCCCFSGTSIACFLVHRASPCSFVHSQESELDDTMKKASMKNQAGRCGADISSTRQLDWHA